MPKRSHKIEFFHGGINSNSDPRDIADLESPSLIDAKIDKVGTLQLMEGTTTSATSNSLTILPNYGLYIMGADRQLDGGSSNENIIFAYDTNDGKIDARDSEGWDANVINIGSNATPVFYKADGNLRIADSTFTNSSRWFGYITDDRFDSLRGDSGSIGWYDTAQSISAPTKGKCVISSSRILSTPETNGLNSSSGEYISDGSGDPIGAAEAADVVCEFSSVNLRVGFQMNERFGISNSSWDSDNNADPPDTAFSYRASVTGSDVSTDATPYTRTVDHSSSTGGIFQPLGGTPSVNSSQNLEIRPSVANAIMSKAYWKKDVEMPSEDLNICALFYVEDNAAGWQSSSVDELHFMVKIALNDDNFYRWRIDKSQMKPDCWNVMVMSTTNYVEKKGTVEWGSLINSSQTTASNQDRFYIEMNDNDDSKVSTVWHLGGFFYSPVVSDIKGYDAGTYSWYYTWLYDDTKQESLPFKFKGSQEGGTYQKNFNKIHICNGAIMFEYDMYILPSDDTGTYSLDKRITGSRLYWKKEESEDYNLIGETDFVEKDFKWLPESKNTIYSIADTASTAGMFNTTKGDGMILKGIQEKTVNKVDTFLNINGYSSLPKTLDCQYKTAVFHGRRVYVGNIKQSGVTHNDRMLKSEINEFDLFPEGESSVDVAIRDGEDIVHLEAYADRILQFKNESLYIINVSENMDFLEDSFPDKGCLFTYHVTKTDGGVAWFNINGAYFYDGRQVFNILEKNEMNIINQLDWEKFITNGEDGSADDLNMSSAHIAYIPLLIKNKNSDILLYDMVLKAWTKGSSKIPISTNMTNFILDSDRKLFYMTDSDSDFVTFDNESTTSTSFRYQTKDIDFGDPSVRKKIYKVYITYQSETSSNVEIKYAVNGNTTFDKVFKDGTNFTSNKLDGTSNTNWNQAVLIPNNSSEASNIYSFALNFLANGTVPSDFKINDIVIIYRTKPIK